MVGLEVGSMVGSYVGSVVGSFVGSLVGSVVGSIVGSVVGEDDDAQSRVTMVSLTPVDVVHGDSGVKGGLQGISAVELGYDRDTGDDEVEIVHVSL